MAELRSYAPVSAIEKAYIRGLREGQRRGAAKIAEQGVRITELSIRLKTAKGALKRSALPSRDSFREIVGAAEIWRHWWLKTHGHSFTAGDPEMESLLELRDAAEVALEHQVAMLTGSNS